MGTSYFPIVILILCIIAMAVIIRSDDKRELAAHPILHKIRKNFSRIDPKFGKIPIYEGSSSYTENKSTITICLRDPDTDKFYDMNTIMYVALHELAHVVTNNGPEDEHGDKFKQNFSQLLSHANSVGVYDSSQPIPETYCGVTK
jgi:hypothetical protein